MLMTQKIYQLSHTDTTRVHWQGS